MKLEGLHILLTYQCTCECDHCFVWGSPWQTGTLTLQQIEQILLQAKEAGVNSIYFEGGEPFLYYAVLVQAVRRATKLGFSVGIVTNAYWANTVADAEEWLRPFAGRLADLTVSSDRFHCSESMGERPQNAIPDTGTGVMTIEPLGVEKRREGGTLRVTVRIQVTGFKVRPEGNVFAIDLAEDVETIGPDGVVIEGLSRPDVERFAGNTSLATGAFASFTTNLTMDPNSVPGTYMVKLTVRDLVGGGRIEHTAAVDIP